jgi:acetyl esterase/lipase
MKTLLIIALSCSLLLEARARPRDITPVHLVADIPYKQTADGDLKLDLYYPEKKLRESYPVVIYTHGGGWVTGDKAKAGVARIGTCVHALTERGIAVAAVQYRLYRQGGNITIRDCVTDSKDALRYLVKHAAKLHLDPSRVGSFGDSAGGQIAQMLLLSSPQSLPGEPSLADADYTMRGGVSWYGPCDFEDPQLFNPDGRPNFRDRFGARILPPDHDPKDKLELYREVSPVNYLASDSPPLLMLQGNMDTTIPVHHARHMQARAKELGAPVEIVIVKNAGHNWRTGGDGRGELEPSQDEIIKRSAEFLARHLTK